MSKRPICLITGASAGIGAATARLAAMRGYDLLLGYRSDAAGAEAAAKAARDAGAKAVIAQGDVGQPEDVNRLFQTLDQEFGHIDALVNNAGIVAPSARLTGIDNARLQTIFQVNVIGAMMVAREATRRMEAQGAGGAIVNIGSAAARLGSGGQYLDYAASKAAIDTFTKGLSDEVAPSGIRVTCVRPGIIDTELHGKGGEPDRADRMGPMVPMRRKGSADEVAEAILWLMSDAASYITGTSIDVTGGR